MYNITKVANDSWIITSYAGKVEVIAEFMYEIDAINFVKFLNSQTS
jgi:hypothetical protein